MKRKQTLDKGTANLINGLIDEALKIYDEKKEYFKKDLFNCRENLLNIQYCIESPGSEFFPARIVKKNLRKIIIALQSNDIHALHWARENTENALAKTGYLKPITAYPSEIAKSHP